MDPLLALIAIGLGLKHSFDADHLVAVGGIFSRAGSSLQATRLSLWWSAGHLATAGLITALLFLGRETVWPQLLARAELLVPIMLVVIGASGLLVAARTLHVHRHVHGPRAHTHLHLHLDERHEARRLGGIGLVHGLASNDELLLVLTATLGAATLADALLLVVLFSLGVVLGMVAYAAALQRLVTPQRRPAVAWWANVVLSALSIGYAVYLWLAGASLNLLPGSH